MFILLFIVLRHQYLCSAVWTVCSYTSNAWSTTSKIRVAECLSLRACSCVRAWRRGWCLTICESVILKLLEFALLSAGECRCLLHLVSRVQLWLASIVPKVTGTVMARRNLESHDCSHSCRSIRMHNPRFSRSITYNVITVELTGHSSCSPPYVAAVRFWLVNDCLFFAGYMESALYSLSLYSHWLTPGTNVGTVIVPHCWSALWIIATHWVAFTQWVQFAILSVDYWESFLLHSAAERLEKMEWHQNESWYKFDLAMHLCLECTVVFCYSVSHCLLLPLSLQA